MNATRYDLLFGVDHNVALPLAVAIASVARSMRPPEALRVFVIGQGFDGSLRRRIETIKSPVTVEVVWLDADDRRLPTVPKDSKFPQATYFRGLLGEHLPDDAHRVVYLDADTVIVAPFSDLSRIDLAGAVIGAVVDANRPEMAMVRSSGWRRAGIVPEAPYFNAGVMVIDVDAWRAEDVGNRLFRYVQENLAELDFADQDALNVVLHGRWKALDASWNQTASVHLGSGPVHERLTPEELDALRRNPRLVHFTGALPRPWKDPQGHPLAHLWFEALQSTSWAGWRPNRLMLTARRARRSLKRIRHR